MLPAVVSRCDIWVCVYHAVRDEADSTIKRRARVWAVSGFLRGPDGQPAEVEGSVPKHSLLCCADGVPCRGDTVVVPVVPRAAGPAE